MTHHPSEAAHTEASANKDPVCGMTVSPDSRFRHLHNGQYVRLARFEERDAEAHFSEC